MVGMALKILSLRNRMPWLARALPGAIRRRIAGWAIRLSPDRRYLERTLLPALADLRPQRVLFVGTQFYTCHYGAWFTSRGSEYWTMDIDPRQAAYGAGGRHVVGSVVEADRHFPPAYFDQVLLNGVFGWGVDTDEDRIRTLAALRRIMKDDGLLIIGWNSDRGADPAGFELVRRAFRHGGCERLPLTRRQAFRGSTHVYDVLVAIREGGFASDSDAADALLSRIGPQGNGSTQAVAGGFWLAPELFDSLYPALAQLQAAALL